MIACAPGKVVLSGAYVVLDGARAVVAAVDRYAIADAGRPPAFIGPELRAAFGNKAVPFVDTSALRDGGRKLGLGSSAACLVAALAAADVSIDRGTASFDPQRIASIIRRAYDAHRAAQGGGSGIDVVASAAGGHVCCVVQPSGPPAHTHLVAPPGLVIEVWACAMSASTAAQLSRVREAKAREPARIAAIMARAAEGAERFADGYLRADARLALDGAVRQQEAMLALGEASGAPIIPRDLHGLCDIARESGAVFAQSGAGGGDVMLHIARAPSSLPFREAARARSLSPLRLVLGAHGARPGLPGPP